MYGAERPTRPWMWSSGVSVSWCTMRPWPSPEVTKSDVTVMPRPLGAAPLPSPAPAATCSWGCSGYVSQMMSLGSCSSQVCLSGYMP